MVARPVGWKGHDVFLDAAAAVRRRCPDARFLLVGSAIPGSPEEDRTPAIRRRIGDLALEDALTWFSKREDMPTVLRALDVFVSASRDEPLGLAALEALACGVPVVASRAGGPREVLASGGGLLAAPGDAAAFAGAILRLLDDAALYVRLSAEARAAALSRYDVRAHARVLEDLYGEILEG
jgi:glycosyltransferase involved in cell wall biosynthesis